MANEKRLIDANALLELVQFRLPIDNQNAEVIAGCVNITRRLIENAPTVDAVEVPCKVGNTVFFVDTECDENGKESLGISVGKIHSFSIQSEGLWAYCRYESGLTYWHKVDDYFGKTVFLTEEEAKVALAKMDGGNEDG